MDTAILFRGATEGCWCEDNIGECTGVRGHIFFY